MKTNEQIRKRIEDHRKSINRLYESSKLYEPATIPHNKIMMEIGALNEMIDALKWVMSDE